MTERRAMIDRDCELSIRQQCALLGVNRSGVYYESVGPDDEEFALMRRIDELHLEHPFFGSRKMVQVLKAEGREVNRKRIQRLMRVMDLEGMAPKPNTSKPAPEHPVFPYLLRNLKVSRPRFSSALAQPRFRCRSPKCTPHLRRRSSTRPMLRRTSTTMPTACTRSPNIRYTRAFTPWPFCSSL